MPSPRLDQPHLDWNTVAILEKAGGSAAAIRELLISQNFPAPNELTVYQWKHRRMVPQRWVPTIVYAILRAKKAKLSELLVRVTPA